jgi:hypothetical protein
VKYALFGAVFLLIGWQGPPPQKAATDNPEKNAQSHQKPTAQPVPPVSHDSTNGNQNQSPEKTATNNEKSVRIVSTPKIQTESKKDFYDKALVVATWLLVFVGGFQILYLWLTVIATKDNAKAAFRNAQALINAERPWLVVNTFFKEKDLTLFHFGCRNQGNTPAKIISVSAELRFVDLLDNLPKPPIYSCPTTLPDLHLIVHTDSFEIEKGINPESFLSQNAEMRSLVYDDRVFLVYYGNVVYRDILYEDSSREGEHETRWCFIYKPSASPKFTQAAIAVLNPTGTFVRGGPNEYNKYT